MEMQSEEGNKILAAIENMRRELNEKTDKVMETISHKIKVMEEDITVLKEEKTTLENKVAKLELKIKGLEQESRKKHLIIHGITENQRNTVDLEETVVKFLEEQMKLTIKKDEIEYVSRLGPESGRNRPIRLILTTRKTRNTIISKKNSLKNTNIYISEDFPKETLEVRKGLIQEMKKQRKNGKIAYIDYDKLVVRDTVVKQRNKRMPSEEGNKTPDQNKIQQRVKVFRERSSTTGSKSQTIQGMFSTLNKNSQEQINTD